MRLGYIYKITNDINDKVYIGQTSRDIDIRFREHCFDTRSTSKIHKAIQKYGYTHFHIEEIEKIPLEQLDERERYWISCYDSVNNGYNILPGGNVSECRYWNSIRIVENNLVIDSKEELARIISRLTSWGLNNTKVRIGKSINSGTDFCGYHFQNCQCDVEELSSIEDIEDWVKTLSIRFTGKHVYCQELDKNFETIAAAAQYCLDNNLYTGVSVTPLQNIVTAIGKQLHGKTQVVDCIGGLHFEFVPGSTKQTGGTFEAKRVYCPQIDKTFESQIEAAHYFIDNQLFTGIKFKTAKLRISDVARGAFPSYKGYTFENIVS